MNEVVGSADSGSVTSSAGSEDDRGAAIQRRIDALGISDREWHAQTGIDRKTLHRAIRNEPGTRPSTYTAIEAEMDKLEAKFAGRPVSQRVPEERPNVMRVEVQGVYGAKALVFEAPVENLAELEAMVDRVMRRLANEAGESTP